MVQTTSILPTSPQSLCRPLSECTNRDNLSLDYCSSLHPNYCLPSREQRVVDVSFSPFLSSARHGRLEELEKYLLPDFSHLWSSVDLTFQQNALHLATRYGHLSIAKRLCEHSYAAKWLSAGDVFCNTPLHIAASKSRQLVHLLLERGASVLSMNQAYETPLSVHVRTATKDDSLLLEKLLQHGADPNCLVHAISVLHIAIDRGYLNMACRLIRFGARLDAKDGHGRMVFDKINQRACYRLFAHISSPLPWIPDDDRKHCMQCIKKFNALINRRHHCRHCGRLVCASCASSFMQLTPTRQHKPERVCTTCANVLKGCTSVQKTTRRASVLYNQLMNGTH